MQADREAIVEQLWESCHRQVLAYALRRTDAASAHDVVAETFLAVWRRSGQIPDPPLPWLLGIARRVLANRRRGDARRAAVAQRIVEQAQPQTPTGLDPDRPLLRALAALSDNDREALLLVAWDGLTSSEAAEVLGCSRATFDAAAHRARRRLTRELARSVPDVPITQLQARRT